MQVDAMRRLANHFPRSRAMSLLKNCPAKREQQAVMHRRHKAGKQFNSNGGRQAAELHGYDARQQGHQAEPDSWAEERNTVCVGARQLSPRGMRNNSKQRRACRTMKRLPNSSKCGTAVAERWMGRRKSESGHMLVLENGGETKANNGGGR